MRNRSILSCLLFLFSVQACETDETKGPVALTGVVTSSGIVVTNAVVTLANNASTLTTTSGIDGKFEFVDINKGDYILTIKSEDTSSKFIQYQKNVAVLNENGEEAIELPQGVTLDIPSNVTDNTVELRWTKSALPNFLEYKLYRHNTSGLDETTGELIHVSTNAADTVFTDAGLSESEEYFYRVFVRNSFGFYGGSNIVSGSTIAGNYFINGDFEDGLNGWELYSPNPCAALADDPTSPAGSKVLELKMDQQIEANVSAEILQYISQSKFISGATYEITFWAKSDIPTNATTWISLLPSSTWYPASSMTTLTVSSNKEWTKYTSEFIAPNFNSPALLVIEADPFFPWSDAVPYRVLLDGFIIHRKK